jgi:hypothetical protein
MRSSQHGTAVFHAEAITHYIDLAKRWVRLTPLGDASWRWQSGVQSGRVTFDGLRWVASIDGSGRHVVGVTRNDALIAALFDPF